MPVQSGRVRQTEGEGRTEADFAAAACSTDRSGASTRRSCRSNCPAASRDISSMALTIAATAVVIWRHSRKAPVLQWAVYLAQDQGRSRLQH